MHVCIRVARAGRGAQIWTEAHVSQTLLNLPVCVQEQSDFTLSTWRKIKFLFKLLVTFVPIGWDLLDCTAEIWEPLQHITVRWDWLTNSGTWANMNSTCSSSPQSCCMWIQRIKWNLLVGLSNSVGHEPLTSFLIFNSSFMTVFTFPCSNKSTASVGLHGANLFRCNSLS